MMFGLTGGIGSGKSTVAAQLAARGALVIDADAIARSVVEPRQPALARLVERFGAGILDASGALDRPKLAAVAFATPEATADLEAITHPAIAEEFLGQVAAAPVAAVVIHDVPLLVESTRGAGYEAVIVVEAPLDIRLERLEARGVDRDDAQRRIARQASDADRRAVATWLIDNGGDRAALEAQVDALWLELVRRATGDPVPN